MNNDRERSSLPKRNVDKLIQHLMKKRGRPIGSSKIFGGDSPIKEIGPIKFVTTSKPQQTNEFLKKEETISKEICVTPLVTKEQTLREKIFNKNQKSRFHPIETSSPFTTKKLQVSKTNEDITLGTSISAIYPENLDNDCNKTRNQLKNQNASEKENEIESLTKYTPTDAESKQKIVDNGLANDNINKTFVKPLSVTKKTIVNNKSTHKASQYESQLTNDTKNEVQNSLSPQKFKTLMENTFVKDKILHHTDSQVNKSNSKFLKTSNKQTSDIDNIPNEEPLRRSLRIRKQTNNSNTTSFPVDKKSLSGSAIGNKSNKEEQVGSDQSHKILTSSISQSNFKRANDKIKDQTINQIPLILLNNIDIDNFVDPFSVENKTITTPPKNKRVRKASNREKTSNKEENKLENTSSSRRNTQNSFNEQLKSINQNELEKNSKESYEKIAAYKSKSSKDNDFDIPLSVENKTITTLSKNKRLRKPSNREKTPNNEENNSENTSSSQRNVQNSLNEQSKSINQSALGKNSKESNKKTGVHKSKSSKDNDFVVPLSVENKTIITPPKNKRIRKASNRDKTPNNEENNSENTSSSQRNVQNSLNEQSKSINQSALGKNSKESNKKTGVHKTKSRKDNDFVVPLSVENKTITTPPKNKRVRKASNREKTSNKEENKSENTSSSRRNTQNSLNEQLKSKNQNEFEKNSKESYEKIAAYKSKSSKDNDFVVPLSVENKTITTPPKNKRVRKASNREKTSNKEENNSENTSSSQRNVQNSLNEQSKSINQSALGKNSKESNKKTDVHKTKSSKDNDFVVPLSVENKTITTPPNNKRVRKVSNREKTPYNEENNSENTSSSQRNIQSSLNEQSKLMNQTDFEESTYLEKCEPKQNHVLTSKITVGPVKNNSKFDKQNSSTTTESTTKPKNKVIDENFDLIDEIIPSEEHIILNKSFKKYQYSVARRSIYRINKNPKHKRKWRRIQIHNESTLTEASITKGIFENESKIDSDGNYTNNYQHISSIHSSFNFTIKRANLKKNKAKLLQLAEKKKILTQNVRRSIYGKANDENLGLRRSNRIRKRPRAYWLNEEVSIEESDIFKNFIRNWYKTNKIPNFPLLKRKKRKSVAATHKLSNKKNNDDYYDNTNYSHSTPNRPEEKTIKRLRIRTKRCQKQV